MEPVGVALVLAGLVAASSGLGALWRSRQGRVRHTGSTTIVRASEVPELRRFGSGATLLQFSTVVCAPCVATAALLGAVAHSRTGVAHIDLDVTDRPELASRFRVLQTPTTLILDRRGVVRARIGGAPRRDALLAELDRITAA